AKRPRDVGLLRDAAAIANATGDSTTAHRHLQQALRLDPDDPHAHLVQGLVLWSDNDRPAAVRAFTAAVANGPDEPSHHRALIVGLIETGRPHDALTACDQALTVAVSPRAAGRGTAGPDPDGIRIVAELEALRARISATIADREDRQAGKVILEDAAERLQATLRRHRDLPPEARAELLTREAYLWVRLGDRRTARKRLNDAARLIDDKRPAPAEYDRLRSLLSQRSPSWTERAAVVALAMVLIGVAVVEVTRYIFWLGNHTNQGLSSNGVVLLVLSLALVVVAPQVLPRIRAVNVRDIGVELAELRPGDDLVRIDLDSSTGRITQISGFTNFRPSVPLEDTESRIKDPSL
ncbi:MAG: tetratricopeptide repeat protein, partial [Acidimicrobiales bacterium]